MRAGLAEHARGQRERSPVKLGHCFCKQVIINREACLANIKANLWRPSAQAATHSNGAMCRASLCEARLAQVSLTRRSYTKPANAFLPLTSARAQACHEQPREGASRAGRAHRAYNLEHDVLMGHRRRHRPQGRIHGHKCKGHPVIACASAHQDHPKERRGGAHCAPDIHCSIVTLLLSLPTPLSSSSHLARSQLGKKSGSRLRRLRPHPRGRGSNPMAHRQPH